MNRYLKILFVFMIVVITSISIVYAAVGETYIKEFEETYYKEEKKEWDFSGKSNEDLEKLKEEVTKKRDEAITASAPTETVTRYNEAIKSINVRISLNNENPTTGVVSEGEKETATVSVNDSDETKLNYTAEKIIEYKRLFGWESYTTDEIRDKWQQTLEDTNDGHYEDYAEELESWAKDGYIIYQNPEKISSSTSGEQSLSDVITDASQFISSGLEQEDIIDSSALQNFSKTYYNILFAIGVATSVIVGMILGIKIMMSTTDQKAEAKQLLVPYVVGCVIVFSGFAIWKLAVTILGSI